MRKVNYKNNVEKEQLIRQAEQKGEILVEDAVLYSPLVDEKYLIFDIPKEKQKSEPIQTRTREQINAQVVAKIREKYSIDDEFKMHRLGMQDKNNLEYLKYINYVQQCIDWGENEKKKLDLGVV